MLEILFLIHLCRQMGNKVRSRGGGGGSATWYQFLVVLLWFGGEVLGGLVAAILLGGRGGGLNLFVYLAALVGAGLGAALAFFLAGLTHPSEPREPRGFPVYPPGYGPGGRDPGQF